MTNFFETLEPIDKTFLLKIYENFNNRNIKDNEADSSAVETLNNIFETVRIYSFKRNKFHALIKDKIQYLLPIDLFRTICEEYDITIYSGPDINNILNNSNESYIDESTLKTLIHETCTEILSDEYSRLIDYNDSKYIYLDNFDKYYWIDIILDLLFALNFEKSNTIDITFKSNAKDKKKAATQYVKTLFEDNFHLPEKFFYMEPSEYQTHIKIKSLGQNLQRNIYGDYKKSPWYQITKNKPDNVPFSYNYYRDLLDNSNGNNKEDALLNVYLLEHISGFNTSLVINEIIGLLDTLEEKTIKSFLKAFVIILAKMKNTFGRNYLLKDIFIKVCGSRKTISNDDLKHILFNLNGSFFMDYDFMKSSAYFLIWSKLGNNKSYILKCLDEYFITTKNEFKYVTFFKNPSDLMLNKEDETNKSDYRNKYFKTNATRNFQRNYIYTEKLMIKRLSPRKSKRLKKTRFNFPQQQYQ